MQQIFGRIVSCLCLLSSLPAFAKGSELVSWCSFDLPPMYIASGPDAGQGTVDIQARFLMRHLPEYAHEFHVSNIRRLEEQIKAGQHVVCAGMQKNADREASMLFSEPFQATAPPTIVLPRKHLAAVSAYLGPDGAVQLPALLQDRRLHLGVTFGRSYGRAIDDLLALHKGSASIVERTSAQRMSEGLLQMMALGRIEYTILFPGERRALLGSPDAAPADLLSLPISGQPRYNTVHVVAPRNAWGRVFIQRVDNVLRQFWLDKEFRAATYRLPEPAQKEELDLLREIDPRRRAGKRPAQRD